MVVRRIEVNKALILKYIVFFFLNLRYTAHAPIPTDYTERAIFPNVQLIFVERNATILVGLVRGWYKIVPTIGTHQILTSVYGFTFAMTASIVSVGILILLF